MTKFLQLRVNQSIRECESFRHLQNPYPLHHLARVHLRLLHLQAEVVLHPSLNMHASFVWDVAQSPEEFLQQCDSSPAAKWATDGEPLSDFTLTLEGIYEWKIDVVARGDDLPYPAMKDIFLSIYENMSKLVGKEVVDRLHPHTRKRVFAAREARCTEFSLNSAEEPLRRVDFLIGARRFLGVSASLGTQKLVLNVGTLASPN
ncbi:hypothetical protein BJ912DRAFT_1005055 [Pholiota molesta]|nr:hypothetical protein BJ912DRAFT_1005055 [Pholiota molesta]